MCSAPKVQSPQIVAPTVMASAKPPQTMIGDAGQSQADRLRSLPPTILAGMGKGVTLSGQKKTLLGG